MERQDIIVMAIIGIMVIAGTWFAYKHDEAINKDCRDAGGIPISMRYEIRCLHPSAFIEMKEK